MLLKNTEGVVFEIKEKKSDDKNGTTTTVYLKGCPLTCVWCANPEGQNIHPELMCKNSKIRDIPDFEKFCDKGAISKNETGIPVFKKEICDSCVNSVCIENSVNESLKLSKEKITAEELFYKIINNHLNNYKLKGVIILSGGEPLAQPQFVKDFINLCISNGVEAGLETSGFFNWLSVKDFIKNFSFVFFDFKILDSYTHQELTGRDNKIILENLRNLAKIIPDKITLTIPVIHSINASPDMMNSVADLCVELNITKIKLIPYYTSGISKYSELRRFYVLPFAKAPSESDLFELKKIFDLKGLNCMISNTK